MAYNLSADGNFASALSTRVSGGSVIGFDGNVAFGSLIGLVRRITGGLSPRLSVDQNSFHTLVEIHGGTRRSPDGRQQFVNGQLNNSFVPGLPTRLTPPPPYPQPNSPPVPWRP